MRIAILENDQDQANVLMLWLQEEEWSECYHFLTGESFIDALKRESYDLLLIDWMLPDINGDKVLEWVRQNLDWPIPIIFVSRRDSVKDLAYVLDLGADDYLIKPVKPIELKARIKALTRRVTGEGRQAVVLEYGRFRLDRVQRKLFFDGHPVALTQKELELAVFMFNHSGRLLSRNHLLKSVWGHGGGVHTRTLDTHISRLRKKLGLHANDGSGWVLGSVYHHGYRLEQIDNGVQ